MTTLCRSKAAYTTPALAMQHLRARRRHERAALYAYKCQECAQYHLTKLRPPAEANLEKP
jgi:hypothetical protein